MIGHTGKEYGFDRLFDAVRYAPSDVPSIVKEEPELLKCENYAGETVLQFFSMEGDAEIVNLLLCCGAIADEWSIYYACGFAHFDTIILLLESGGIPNVESCKFNFMSSEPNLFLKKEMHKLFRSYGFDW